MRKPGRCVGLLRLLLVASSVLGAMPAVAQSPTAVGAELSAIRFRDVDNNGITSCGDYLLYTLTVQPAGGALVAPRFAIDNATNLNFDPSTLTLPPGSVVVTNDPLRIDVQLPNIPNGSVTTVTFEGLIAPLNLGSAVVVQGTVTSSNFGDVSTDGVPGPGAQPTTTPYTPCPPPIGLRVTKTASLVGDVDGDGLADPGDDLRYTVIATNSGLTSQAAVFTSGAPANTSLTVGSVTTTRGTVVRGNNPGNTDVQVTATLPPSSTTTISFRVSITRPLPAAVTAISCQGVLTSPSGAFAAILTDDPTTAAPFDATVTPVDRDPDLALTKTGPASLAPGVPGVFTLVATNQGGAAAVGAVLTEDVPAGTVYDPGSSSPGWSCAGSACTRALGTVGVGSTASSAFGLRVVAVTALQTMVQNHASVTDSGQNGPDTDPTNNTATATAAIVGAVPDLAVAKTDAGATTSPSGSVPYTVSVTNVGSREATGVVVVDNLPAHVSADLAHSTGVWTCGGGACTWSIASLPVGEKREAILTVEVAPTVPAGYLTLINGASAAEAAGLDPDLSNNSASETTPILGAAPELHMSKTLDPASQTIPGGLVVFVLTASNTGTTGTGVVFEETVPDGFVFEGANSTPGWACLGAGCSFEVAKLAAGTQVVVRFAVRVPALLPAGSLSLVNCATLRSDKQTPPVVSCVEVPLDAAPDLALSKSDGDATARPGDTVLYTLTVRNLGNRGASGVVIDDALPAGTTADLANSSPGWSCTGTPVVCHLALSDPVEAAELATVGLAMVTNAAGADEDLLNVAVVGDDGRNGPDPNGANNTGSDTTPVRAEVPAQLAATLRDSLAVDADGSGMASPGDTLEYVLVVQNLSTTPARASLINLDPAALDPYLKLVEGSVVSSGGTILRGNSAGDVDIAVDAGEIAGGGSVMLRFRLQIDPEMPESVSRVSAQAIASASNAAAVASDDPDTSEANDPTQTPLVRGVVAAIPTLGGVGTTLLMVALGSLAVVRFRRGRSVA